MGTITKVFVILNMVFCIAFVTVSATVLSQRHHWREKHDHLQRAYKTLEGDLKTAQGTYTADMEKFREESRTATENAADLEEQLAAQKKLVAERDDTVAATKKEAAAATALATNLGDNMKGLTKDLLRVQGELEAARAELARQRQEVDDSKTAQVALIARIAALDLAERRLLRRIEEVQGQLARTSKYESIVRAMAPTVHDRAKEEAMGQGRGAIPAHTIHGAVKAVDTKMGVVVLNVGSETRPPVKEGYQFLIYRDGKLMAITRVTTVDKKMSACRIVPPALPGPVRVGDSAMTRY